MELVTPRQVAQAVGASEASLKRWCDKGLLPVIRTAGGHRRLPINGVVQWLRATGRPIVRPEVLGLPSHRGGETIALQRSVDLLRDSLQAGDEQRSRQTIVNLYLAAHRIADVCDAVIAPAFEALGSVWQHGELEVYQERRGCEICMAVLHELKGLLPAPAEGAPYAIGGTLTQDPYTLSNAMVELSLREAGWLAESHGGGNPGATLAAAIKERRPDMFWLSVSTFDSPEEFVAEYQAVAAAALECGVPIAVGGRALAPAVRQQMTYAAYCDKLRHLVAFAEALAPAIVKTPRPRL